MPWIRFERDFDWRPTPRVTIAHKAGKTYLVTTPCAAAAISAGAGVKVMKPIEESRDGKDTDCG